MSVVALLYKLRFYINFSIQVNNRRSVHDSKDHDSVSLLCCMLEPRCIQRI